MIVFCYRVLGNWIFNKLLNGNEGNCWLEFLWQPFLHLENCGRENIQRTRKIGKLRKLLALIFNNPRINRFKPSSNKQGKKTKIHINSPTSHNLPCPIIFPIKPPSTWNYNFIALPLVINLTKMRFLSKNF